MPLVFSRNPVPVVIPDLSKIYSECYGPAELPSASTKESTVEEDNNASMVGVVP